MNNCELLSEYKDLLTVEDIQEITGQSRQTIRRIMSEGVIPSVRIGHRWYSPKPKFIEFLERGVNDKRKSL